LLIHDGSGLKETGERAEIGQARVTFDGSLAMISMAEKAEKAEKGYYCF